MKLLPARSASSVSATWFGVEVCGFRGQGLGSGVLCLVFFGFRVWGVRVEGGRLRFEDFRFQVLSDLRVEALGLRLSVEC